MRHLDLFSGIGGFALAASWVWKEEYETIAFVEREKYCQRVLRKNFPGVPICEDIYEAKGEDYTPVDLLTGGFPCQPFSVAGKQRGKEDDRYLWPEMLRIIREARPRWVIGENVIGFINMGLDEVSSDLESEGYETRPFIIPACATDADHRRDRVWIIAYSDKHSKSNVSLNGNAGQGQLGVIPNFKCNRWYSGSEQTRRLAGDEINGHGGETSSFMANPKSTTERSGLCESRPAELRRGRFGNSGCKDNVPNPESIMSRHGDHDDVQEIRHREEKGGSRCAIQSAEPWPVEPAVGGSFNGFPDWLYRHCGRGLSFEESTRKTNILRELWTENIAKTLWETVGGFNRIQKAEILFAVMCEYERRPNKARVFMESQKALEKFVRGLWSQGQITGSPHQSGNKRQCPRKHPNTLQTLSRLLAHNSETNWQISCWEDDIPRIANGIPRRKDRLKGLGNAIVPQVAAVIMQTIKDLS